jgi:CheY-like chemotaxis protein
MAEQPVEQPLPDVSRGIESILVVDDDPAPREVFARLLRRLGYRVASVESGEEAVAFLRRQPVHLVVLDMMMSGIDGTETLRQALEIRPELKAIIASGFAESDRVREAIALGAGAFVLKPLTRERLAEAVRHELDRRT